jgi:hypothetical protein
MQNEHGAPSTETRGAENSGRRAGRFKAYEGTGVRVYGGGAESREPRDLRTAGGGQIARAACGPLSWVVGSLATSRQLNEDPN